MNTSPGEKGVVLKLADQAHQLFLVEVARARGLKSFAPGRSRTKAMVYGSPADVRAVLADAAKITATYERGRIALLVDILEQNHLRVPFKLMSSLGMAEVRDEIHQVTDIPREMDRKT